MRKSGLIQDREVFIAPKSIQEDEIPRDGGLWPEYAHTMIVCVDRYEDGIAEGRLYSYCLPKACTFRSLDQMLFSMEDVMDESGLVQAWNQPRSLTEKKERRRQIDVCKGEDIAPSRPEPLLSFRSLRPLRGKRASFYLRVYSRQHASMQGVLTWAERLDKPTAFRSALELVRMMRGALEASRPLEKEK